MAVQSGVVGEEWWLENHRMTRALFCLYVINFIISFKNRYNIIYIIIIIVVLLCDVQVIRFRQPVSAEEWVAVTVWKLATNIEYRTLSDLLGLGRTTIGKIVIETCKAIST